MREIGHSWNSILGQSPKKKRGTRSTVVAGLPLRNVRHVRSAIADVIYLEYLQKAHKERGALS